MISRFPLVKSADVLLVRGAIPPEVCEAQWETYCNAYDPDDPTPLYPTAGAAVEPAAELASQMEDLLTRGSHEFGLPVSRFGASLVCYVVAEQLRGIVGSGT